MVDSSVSGIKKEVRRAVRERLRGMSGDEMSRESMSIWQKVESLEEFVAADVVALYWSLPDEPFSHDVVRRWSEQKTVLLPCIESDEIVFRRYDGSGRMCEGMFNISEPLGAEWSDLYKIDMIVVPGVAFSPSGVRLGRGRGFYDRLFARMGFGQDKERQVIEGTGGNGRKGVGPVTVGVCFSCQIVPNVPAEAHDIALDMVISA